MAVGAFARLLSPVGTGLVKAGKGVGTAAQYASLGDRFSNIGRAVVNPLGDPKNLQRLGLAGQAAGFLALPSIMEGIRTDRMGRPEDDPRVVAGERQLRNEAAQRKLKEISSRRRELEIKNKEQRLQQIAPDLYNRITAGRYLPAGAVVIGGAPRRDLLREFAEAMHEGAFNPPPTNVDVSDLLA